MRYDVEIVVPVAVGETIDQHLIHDFIAPVLDHRLQPGNILGPRCVEAPGRRRHQ